jgi:hypothetical protein
VGLLPLTEVRILALKNVELRTAELFSEQSHNGQWEATGHNGHWEAAGWRALWWWAACDSGASALQSRRQGNGAIGALRSAGWSRRGSSGNCSILPYALLTGNANQGACLLLLVLVVALQALGF